MSLTSVDLDEKVKKMAEAIPYSLKACMEFGIKFLYAQHINTMDGVTTVEYPNNLVSRKLERAMKKLEEVSQNAEDFI